MSKDSSKNPEAVAEAAYVPKKSWLKPKKNELPKNFGRPLRVIATALGIFLVSQFIAGLIIGFGLKLTNPGSDIANNLRDSAPTQFFYILLAEGLAVFLVFSVLKARGLNRSSIGLGRLPKWDDLGKALLGFGAFYVLLIVAGLLLTELAPDLIRNEQQDVGFKNLATRLDEILALIALVVFPPIAEEILIRGYLYSGLRVAMRFVPALLVTSLFFAAAHLQPGNATGLLWGAAINTFLLSVILVYLREKTGALYAGIIVHAANNTVAFLVLFHGHMF